jgi:parallel beta-helix repeat protein
MTEEVGMGGSKYRSIAASLVAPLLAALMIFLAAPAAGASGSKLYVSPTGNDGNPCTEQAPCATIGHAVDVAGAGDTVLVAAGTYAEDVAVPIRLNVVGLGHPVVDAAGLDNGFVITGAGARVSGFTVENAYFEGILVLQTSHVTVTRNVVRDNDQGMFDANPRGQCAPQGEIPGDCGEGVHLMSATKSTVRGNLVTGNSGGILLTDEFGPTAMNTVAFNTVVANLYDCGITVAGHNPGAIDQNGARQPSVAGIYSNLIIKNRADGNGVAGEGAGILLAGAGPGTGVYGNLILNNRAAQNGLAGITLHNHAPNTDLNGNVIVGNVLESDNLNGDPDAGVFETTGILVFSAVDPMEGIVVRGNTIEHTHFGIWTQNLPLIPRRSNSFFDVQVPVHQQ